MQMTLEVLVYIQLEPCQSTIHNRLTESWHDGSVGKGARYEASRPEVDPGSHLVKGYKAGPTLAKLSSGSQ